MEITIKTAAEARSLWQAHKARLAMDGISFPDVQSYVLPGTEKDMRIAEDAQPELVTTANAGIPAFLTTLIDPNVIRVLYSPLNAAQILGEQRKGTWLDDTIMFPLTENSGEVASYGDYSNNGMVNANINWPQRQSYLFQAIIRYGEREMERAGLARINWAQELMGSATLRLNQFQNFTYFFGVDGLQNYGLFNDPGLSAAISPSPKAAGGFTWFTAGGAPNATANEVYNDIVSLISLLISQSGNTITLDSPFRLALSGNSAVALTFTNSFGVNVRGLLKENFPKLEIVTAPQYGEQSASNPQGVVGGNFMQMFALEVQGQKTGFCAFNEKLRAGTIVRGLSSYEQKLVQGTWGAVIQQPFAVSSMLGI